MTRSIRLLQITATCAALLLFALAGSASAVTLTPTDAPLLGSNFQGGDGNQDSAGGLIDWDTIANNAAASLDDNALDSAFAGGNKESDPGDWSFVTEAGGVNPNKDNLFGAWSNSAPNVSGDPNTFLYLAFNREAQTGNTFITFELNQDSRTWNNGNADIACRTDGDLLISYNVESGGSPPNVDIVVYRWIPSTVDQATGCSKTGTFQAIDPQPNAEAAVNANQISNFLSTDLLGKSFAAGTFGEAALNLTGILQLANLNPCESFGQASMHTRSSTSIDSQLQDFIGPIPVVVRSCGLSLQKTGDHIKHDGDPETFNYQLTSIGSQPVAVDQTTGLTDDHCSPVVYDSGDTNGDGLVEAGETWLFHCDYTVNHADENGAHQIINTATANGTVGDTPVSATATWTTLVIHPAIAIDKTGPATANAGDKVGYVLTVTNPGDTGLGDPTVQVSDAQCNGDPVTLIGKGGDPTPDSLDPGDVWTYSCSVQTAATDTAIHNVATVSGCDRLGGCVSAEDAADTTLTPPPATPAAPPEQLVLPERVSAPGRAQLVGPTGCQSRVFSARVRGTNVASVVFVLDGKVVKRLQRPNSKGAFIIRVNPRKLRLGVHRLVANVVFKAGTGTKPKTMRVSFQRCARKLILPRFTG